MAKYKVTTSSGNLNLREYDTTSSKIIATMPKGTIVESYNPPTPNQKCDEGWLYISYGGKYGYASKAYLTPVSTTASNATTTTAKTIKTTNNSTSTSTNSNTNNKNLNEMNVSTTMSESTKKKLKIAGIVVGVAIGGFLVYKAVSKKQPTTTTTTKSTKATKSLNGVKKRKSKKVRKTKRAKKLLKLN